MSDKLIAIDTADPKGSQFATVVVDEIKYLIAQNAGSGGTGGVGPAGPAGPAGPQGPAGATGATGPAGPAGADGQDGADGAPGQGVRYVSTVMRVEDLPATASPGDMYWVETPAPTTAFIWDGSAFVGAGRVQGEPGDDGAPGPAGADGTDGAAGADGVAGPQGDVGPAGSAGNDGAQGEAGPAGPAGPAGVDGADGAVGPQGVPGQDGAEGPAGPKGDPGIQGEQGIQGIQGEQGAPGLGITFKGTVATVDDLPATAAQGDLYVVETPTPASSWIWDDAEQAFIEGGPVQGPQGIQGEQGVAGPAGPAGADGPAGAQGVAGQDGAVGPAGPKGEQGVPGADGPAGPKGDTGPAGPKGDTGPQGPAGNDGTGTAYTLPVATATVLGGVKVGTGLAVDGTGTLSATVATGFLPLSGGTLTGTLTLPSGTPGLAINGTNYNMLGGSGGVAFRSGTTNIMNHTAAEVVAYVPFTTTGAGVGVRFGSGGPTLSKSGTTIASSAPITVAAAPAADTELANKAYVDSKAGTGGGTAYTLPPATATVLGGVKQGTGVTIAADGTLSASGTAYTLPAATATVIGGVKPGAGLTVKADGTLDGVANPVSGAVAGMSIWHGSQAAYDALTKDANTVYLIHA